MFETIKTISNKPTGEGQVPHHSSDRYRKDIDMTLNELIEERKDMTNEEVIKAVMLKMADNYRAMYSELRAEYRTGKREGWDDEALFDMRTDMHDLVTKEILLRELRETLDERCSCYVNGIEY